MARKQNDHYGNLNAYVSEFHEKNKKRIRNSGIVLILLPVILGLIRWFTDSDKIVFLFIWVLCMFAIGTYLISVEYMDHRVRQKLEDITGADDDLGGLLDDYDPIPEKVMEAVRTKAEGGEE